MLTLRHMLDATPAKIKGRARQQCFAQTYAPPRQKAARESLTKSGGYIVEDESGRYREFKFKTKCTDGWRKVAIRFYGPMNPSSRVWCWCSCPYFKYNCEVALAFRGSSAVVQSNGQRPRFTNPKLDSRICKHVYLGFALAMRRRKPGKDEAMGSVNQPKGRQKKRQTVKAVWAGDVLGGTKATIKSAVRKG